MDNVNDLIKTSDPVSNRPQTQQTISLSALKDDSNSVNINATNGLSGVVENNDSSHPIVRINMNRKASDKRVRPTSSNEVHAINPDELIPQKPKVRSVTPRDVAMNDLDRAVARKKKEYEDFVRQASEEDEINRENIEAGLETVSDEMQYMPNELAVDTTFVDDDDFDIDEEYYDNQYTDGHNVVIDDNPFNDDFIQDDIDDTISDTDDSYIEDDHNEEIVNYEDNEVSEDDYDVTDIVEEEVSENVTSNIIEEEHIEKVSVNDSEEDSEEFDIGEGSIHVTSSALEEVSGTSNDFDIDESDFEDVTTETEENLTDEQIMEISEASEKHLRSEILQKIVQTGKKLNTSQFSVSNKVINIKDALKHREKEVERTSTWPLTFAGRPYIASALKGPEIALMADADTSDNDGVGLSMTQARIMFEHDANPFRPSTLEAWAKTIPFADVENILCNYSSS